ncbi:hypothetical protein [Fodinibius saliphilus]|uniref:hypothetical protein n=1 Tax=Fodinibius saliphilus TaxID=1920650 RepID=UPI001107EEE4|nr:hypothetical protein [Fodinibius saliphilus]
MNLPHKLQKAQEAINRPEVQEMLKKLSEYNLGVFMPHMHDDETGGFKLLPENMIQIEENQEVKFMERKKADDIKFVPVGWIWQSNETQVGAKCVAQGCRYIENQSTGDEEHQTVHKRK